MKIYRKIYYKIKYNKIKNKYRVDIIDKLDNNKVISSRIINFYDLYYHLDFLPIDSVGLYIERVENDKKNS